MKIRKKVSIKPSCPPLEERSNEEFMAWSIRLSAKSSHITIKEAYKQHIDYCDYGEHINWDEVKRILKMEE